MRTIKLLAVLVLVTSLVGAQATSSIQEGVFTSQPASTGLIANDLPETVTMTFAKLSKPGAPWMQARFTEVWLQNGAFIRLCGNRVQSTITAGIPGNPVVLSERMRGDRILVEVVLPQNGVASVTMSGFDSGIPPMPTASDSLCDLHWGQDHRLYSVDSKVGRMLVTTATGVNVFTAFLVDDSVLLTAGHCLAGAVAVTMEFNCPLSDAMGNIMPCGPQDVYVADMQTLFAVDNGVCEDYGGFRCFNNVLTNLPPGLVQSHNATKIPPLPITLVEVNGYGPVVPATGVNMVFNRTLRTHVDALVPAPPGCLWYEVDTAELGNDGSPVHDVFDEHVIGIHTMGGCNELGVRNKGTPIDNPGLVAHAAALGVVIPTPTVPPSTHKIFMWQGSGDAPIYGQVSGVPAHAELFNVFSLLPANPTGSGPLFGLNDGIGSADPLAQAASPLGTPPFHVMADQNGRYLLWVPTAAPSLTLNMDMISVALLPGGGISVSDAINVTVRL